MSDVSGEFFLGWESLESGGVAWVIDDHRSARESLVDVLCLLDVPAIGLRSADDAFAKLRTGPLPAAMILDGHLPGMSGATLLAKMKANPTWEGIPVLVITGEDERVAGTEAVLSKPVEVDDLLAALARVMPMHPTVGAMPGDRTDV